MAMNSVLRLERDSRLPLGPIRAPDNDFLRTWSSPGSSAQRKHFARLIEAATREIRGRFPGYFSQFHVEAPPLGALARNIQSLPAFGGFSAADLELALVRGLQVLDELQVRVSLDCDDSDDISMLVLHSILDAYAAAAGSIDLRAPQDDASKPVEPDRELYSLGQTRSGIPFAFAAGAGRPLLILSNTGVPLRIWANLINDMSFRRPWLIVPSRASSLVEGGMPNGSSLLQDVADIRDVLLWNNLNHVDVMAWGNGARTALALARELPKQVDSLMLMSPSFYGARSTQQYPSPFEDFLVEVYEIARQDAATGWALAGPLPEAALWHTRAACLPRNPQERAEAILRLPPQACLKDVFAPLSTIEYFVNYGERILTDAVYDVGAALREVRCPMVLLTGTNDAAVNTQLSRDLLSTYGRDVLHATLSGAGHHIQVLQYGYLRYLLDCLGRESEPESTARLRIARLA
jgi:pimeloyl-ACP methyl ester carboxylesterase